MFCIRPDIILNDYLFLLHYHHMTSFGVAFMKINHITMFHHKINF